MTGGFVKSETGPDSCFREAVADVKPLPRHRARQARRSMPRADSQARRDAAEGLSSRDDGYRWPAAVVVDDVRAGAVLAWKSAGVQERVFQRLKTGQIEIQRELDLHGMTVREAGEAVLQLVEGVRADRQCCVLIIHGRGAESSKPARLKSCVYAWLRQHPRALALHSATPRHGGSGATYALLKRMTGPTKS